MIVQTMNTRYVVEDMGDGAIRISGDPGRCPVPTMARILSEIKVGERMNYRPTEGDWPTRHSATAFVSTSPVVSIED